jgi:hypothetical protein
MMDSRQAILLSLGKALLSNLSAVLREIQKQPCVSN